MSKPSLGKNVFKTQLLLQNCNEGKNKKIFLHLKYLAYS